MKGSSVFRQRAIWLLSLLLLAASIAAIPALNARSARVPGLGAGASGSDELHDGARAFARFGFNLVESAAAAGVAARHDAPTFDSKLSHIMPQVASTGAAVAVADFDRDGWQDFYVTNSREGSLNHLYRNKGDGTFEDVAAALGVADVNQRSTGVSMGAVWGDYDNDGYDDLLLYRYGRPELFHNEQGQRFVAAGARAGLPARVNANAAHVARLRPRRPSRSVHRRLLGRVDQSVVAHHHAHHAGELRVRQQRRPQVSAVEPWRRDVRGSHHRRRHHAVAAGRWRSRPRICSTPVTPPCSWPTTTACRSST